MNRHDLQDLGGGTANGLLASRASYCPDKIALEFRGETFTYRELDRQVTLAGAGLMALGFEKGDAMAAFLTNRPECLTVTMGAGRAGLINVPVNTGFRGAFLEYAIAHSEAKVLLTEARLAESLLTLGTLPPLLRAVVFVDEVPAKLPQGDKVRFLPLAELIAEGSPNPQFPIVHPHDVAGISFTSGTTGRSKGVVSPCLQAVVMARECAAAFELTPRDRLYTAMPLFHGMASVTTWLASIYAGATAILSPQLSISRFWDEVRESKATQFNALGSILHMLMSTPESPLDREHWVTRVFSAPAPADVLYRFESRFGVHVIEGYGQTETKNILYNPIKGRKVGSLGRPTASSIIEIHDDHGERLPPGEIGEIVYRPRIPNIMLKSYFRNPEATLENMRDMWWHTGDLGSMDADGFFYFFDRKKDSLRRRGENISSHELEVAVAAYPGIAEAAAVAAVSELSEDEVMVVIEAANAEGFDFPALFEHCVRNMPRHMVPRYYRIVQTLPRTPTGKVRKVELRDAGITADTWDYVAAGLSMPR